MDYKALLNAQRIIVRFLEVNVNKDTVKDFSERNGLTQIEFANIMGVTKKAVEKWEQGRNKIGGSSAVLLTLLKEEPDLLSKLYFVEKVERPYEPFKEIIKVTSNPQESFTTLPQWNIVRQESCSKQTKLKDSLLECYC